MNQLVNAPQRTASRLANHVIFMSGCHQLVTTPRRSKNGHSRLALCCHRIPVLQEWLLESRCADVCFNWSCRHQVGDVLLSLPPLVSKSAYAPVFSWHHLLSSLLQHLSAPRMVTQDSRCADVCFDWSCRHRVGDVLLSLPLLYPSQPTHPFS